MIKAKDGNTLIDAMLKKGMGIYNFHVEKGSAGLSKEVIQKNSSCHSLCCVDTLCSEANWYGWIIMFDHNGEMYI